MWKLFLFLTGLVLVASYVDVKDETYVQDVGGQIDVQKYKNYFIDILNEVEDKYEEFVENQVPEIKEKFNELSKCLMNLKKNLINKIKSLRNEDLEEPLENVESKDVYFKNALNYIKSFDLNKINLKNFDFDSIKSILNDEFLTDVEKVITAKDILALIMGSHVNRETIELVRNLVEKYKNRDEEWSPVLNEYLNQVLNYFEGFKDTDYSEYWNKMEEMTMKLVDSLSISPDTMSQIKESIVSYYNDLKETMKNKYQSTKENLTGQTEKVKNFVFDKTNLKSYYDDLKDYLETLKDAKDVLKYFKDKRNKVKSIGDNFSDIFKVKHED